MPGASGIQLLDFIKENRPEIPVIIMTAHSDLESAVESYEHSAWEYLPKPFDIEQAINVIKRSIEEESINVILEQIENKKKGEIDQIFVTGCLSERYKSDLEREMPEVDAYFGTTNLPELIKVLEADYKHELLGERLITTPKSYAYLKVSEGCDRPCSFCAIHIMRGNHRSFSIDDFADQSKRLAKEGIKEIILIAQDLTYYGIDNYGERKLADLLKAIVKVTNIMLY